MTKFTFIFIFLSAVGAGAAPCPQSALEWKTWSLKGAASLAASGFERKRARELRNEWRKCSKANAAPACVTPLADFVVAHARHSDRGYSLGATLSDEDYYRNVPFKDMMELPAPLNSPQFLKWMDGGPKDWDRALKAVEKHNAGLAEDKRLHAFLYQSQHLGPPDQSGALGRFFVYVPHDRYEQYLQFALPHPIDDPPEKFKVIRGLSVVTVQTKDKAGKPLVRPQAWFKDFWRLRDKKGNVTVSTRLKERGSMENCTSCHKTALLPITPDPRTFDGARFNGELAWVNRQMNRRGNAEPFAYTPEAFGPAMGPKTSPLRTDAWVKTCAPDLEAASRRRVLFRMRCTNCHNGSQRGELTFPSGQRKQPTTKKDLVTHYVVTHRTMPKGARLTDPERQALVACLKREMYGDSATTGLLEAHLRNESCWKSK